MKTILKTKDLHKVYRLGGFINRIRINALDKVNLHVESDEPVIISLVGESGSGKTTLAKVMLRLIAPNDGQAMVYDQVVAGKGAKTDKKTFMSMVQPIFQNPFEAFSNYRTVDAYLLRTAMKVSGAKGAAAEDLVEEALVAVGMHYADVKGKYPNQFSGGELQRISVARALIPKPSIIIADEPVSMIDASLRMNVINLFLKLKEETRTSFLYITHDLATAYYISDYIAVMYRGTIVEFGNARAILSDPQHPYTQLLLGSVATMGKKWEEADIAMQDMEAVDFVAEGCRFRHRCPLAEQICADLRPGATAMPDGREVYCHIVERELEQA